MEFYGLTVLGIDWQHYISGELISSQFKNNYLNNSFLDNDPDLFHKLLPDVHSATSKISFSNKVLKPIYTICWQSGP